MKKQHYTFNNFSILQMLVKDHVLFSKKILKFKIKKFWISRLSVCSFYNSESDPKIFRFLYDSNHQIVWCNHLQQQCNRLEWFTNILCARYDKIYLHKFLKYYMNKKLTSSLFTSLVTLLFFTIQIFFLIYRWVLSFYDL